MRPGASGRSQAPSAVPDLRPRLGLFLATAGGLALAVALLVGRAPTVDEKSAECRLIAEVAPTLTAGPVFPELGWMNSDPIDCRGAFAAAGLPIGAPVEPSRFRVPVSWKGVVFERPRRLGPDRLRINYGIVCGPLCGEGYDVELVRRNGRWTVVARSQTWIA